MEQIPSSEFSPEEQGLIQLLKEKGFDDQEAHEALMRWMDSEIALAEEGGIAARVTLDLKRAQLYFAAGNIPEARESLEAVFMECNQVPDLDDLYDKALELEAKIEEAE